MALDIIGAGFGRTGTSSMKMALEMLGFGPCYHMIECLPRGPAHYRLWEDAVAGHPDWESIFDGYRSAVDFPAATSYAALADYYPDAKVILTVRDPESWFRSTQDTILAPAWIEWLRNSEAGPFTQGTINDYFDDRVHDREHLLKRFDEHVAAVRERIPADRLLVFEVAEGWKPLCEFLDVPVPAEDFPRVNDTAEVNAVIGEIMARGLQDVFGY